MPKQPELSIVIPAYNEELRIEKTLLAFDWHFSKKYNVEIIVVCDGNKDKTSEIVLKYSKRHKHVHLLAFPTRLGKGGGLIKGFSAAKGNFVGFVDADSSIAPADYERLFQTLKKSNCAGVVASRYLRNSRILIKQPFYRIFLSRCWNLIVRILFNLPFTDTQCGAKLFRRKALLEVLPQLKSYGFEFDVELLWCMQKVGYRVVEVPISWVNVDQSNFKVKDVLGMISRLLKIRLP